MVDPMPMIPTEDPTAISPETTGLPAEAPVEETTELTQMLDSRMNELPDNQKQFILEYMTPELVGVLGLILGNEAVEYYAPFADPGKMLQVIPRPQEQSQAQAAAPQGPQAGPMAAAPSNPPATAPATPSMAPGA